MRSLRMFTLGRSRRIFWGWGLHRQKALGWFVLYPGLGSDVCFVYEYGVGLHSEELIFMH